MREYPQTSDAVMALPIGNEGRRAAESVAFWDGMLIAVERDGVRWFVWRYQDGDYFRTRTPMWSLDGATPSTVGLAPSTAADRSPQGASGPKAP